MVVEVDVDARLAFANLAPDLRGCDDRELVGKGDDVSGYWFYLVLVLGEILLELERSFLEFSSESASD